MKHDVLVTRLKSRMAEMNTNASKVSVEARLGKTAVRDIVAGKSRKPTMDTIARIAKVLDCTLAYLVGDVDEPHQMRSVEGPLDMQMMRVSLIVEIGVFKRDNHPASRLETPVIEHPSYPNHELKACLMADNSMFDHGIMKGDILTIAAPFGDARIPLKDGDLIVCAQTITPPIITEISVRQVKVGENGVELWSGLVDEKFDIIRIANQPSQFPKNLYMSENNDGITIEGIVVRLMRDLG